MRCLLFQIALICLACVVGGCVSEGYDARTQEMIDAFAHGDFDEAIAEADRLAIESDNPKNFSDNRVPRDGLLARLEQGAILRAAGEIEESARVFRRADQIVRIADALAETQVNQEAAALLTNPTAVAYRGTQYDRVMLSVYQAMNHLELGDFELARVYLRQALNRQQAAADEHRAQIERQRKALAAQGRQENVDVDRALGDPGFQRDLAARANSAERQRAIDPPDDLREYANYQNPLVEYLTGVFFTATGDDPERGFAAFERARALEPRNPYLAADVATADRVASGLPVEETVWVIYEAGLAPALDQVKIDVPAFYFGGEFGRLGLPGIALPTLLYAPPASDSIGIDTGQRTYETARLASLDGIVKAEFDADFGRRLTRAITASVLKAAAAYAINRAADEAARDQENTLAGALIVLGSRVGTIGYQYVTNQADQRSWRTLPGRVQVASFPAPVDGRLTLYGDRQRVGVTLDADAVAHVIFVKQTRPDAPLIVRTVSIPRGAGRMRTRAAANVAGV